MQFLVRENKFRRSELISEAEGGVFVSKHFHFPFQSYEKGFSTSFDMFTYAP